MRRVINGKIYNTETAQLIADDTFGDGTNRYTGGRATYLYRTDKGSYFAHRVTCWQGEHDQIEPLTTEEAIELYQALDDSSAVPFEEAFPGMQIEEA